MDRFIYRLIDSLLDSLIYRLIDRLIDRLIYRLIDRLINRLIYRLIDRLIDIYSPVALFEMDEKIGERMCKVLHRTRKQTQYNHYSES